MTNNMLVWFDFFHMLRLLAPLLVLLGYLWVHERRKAIKERNERRSENV